MYHCDPRLKCSSGFTLAETLVALCVGCLLSAVMLNGFRLQMQMQKQMLQQVRERTWLKRALDRIARDVKAADNISSDPTPTASESTACALEGRTPVMKLTPTTPINLSIIYSVGTAPSPIWRGTVLMRCARDPSGVISNRVLIDQLASPPTPWTGCSALLLGNPGTQLANSYQLAFSACRHNDPTVKTGAIRIQLKNLRYSSDSDRQTSERLVMIGNS
ncbi:MAG: hypothetical protein RLZZ516_1755 [Cyanobacteriota bacterium]